MNAEPENDRPRITPESWRPGSTGVGRRRSIVRERPRQMTLLACVLVGLGLLIEPYASGSEFEGTRTEIWITDIPDTGYVIMLGIVLVALVFNRAVADSRLRILHIAPVAVAATMLVVQAQIIRGLAQTTDRWLSGSIGPGPWLVGLGAALAIVGTAWSLSRKWPATAARERVPAAPGEVVTERVPAAASSEAIGVLAGGVLGFLLAVGVVVPVLPTGIPLGDLIVIVALSVGGVWLGTIIGRRLALG